MDAGRPLAAPWSAQGTSGYTMLALGGLALLVPQHEVHTLATIQELERTTQGSDEPDRAEGNAPEWPVYALSEQLEALPALPAEYRICALLALWDGYLGLLCHEVVAVDPSGLRVHAVPRCMDIPHTPVRALAVHQERVLCVTASTDLAGFIAWRRYLPLARLSARQVAA